LGGKQLYETEEGEEEEGEEEKEEEEEESLEGGSHGYATSGSSHVRDTSESLLK
jgi:hypothetical protein